MAPIFKRKTTLGGAPLEPEQAYKAPPPQPTADVVRNAAASLISFPKSDPAPEPKKVKPVCYRDVLVMSRQDVADLFSRVVTMKARNPILGDPSIVGQEIADRKVRIKEVQELIGTRNRRWQKHHRPNDMMSTAELQRLLREDKSELKKLEEEVRERQARLRTWGTNKADIVGWEDTFVDATFEEKYPDLILDETAPVYGWFTYTVQKRQRNPLTNKFEIVNVVGAHAGGYEHHADSRYCIENYRKWLSLGDAALEMASNGMTWEDWTRWENAAILVAITEGLVKPEMEVVAHHPALKRWEIVHEEIEIDHELEHKIILKTGGGALGGATIYSRGWRYGKRSGWTRRALESFDATARIRDNNSGQEYHDAGSADMRDSHNDDNESYVPD